MYESSVYWTDFAERLAALGIEAKLIGALAAMQYRAQPRATVQGQRVAVLVAETEYRRQALDRAVGPVITVQAQSFVAGAVPTPAVMEQRRSEPHEVEDVIVHKLLAWTVRDRDDIAGIFAAGHRLDESYIEQWADAWEIADRWAEAKRALR